MGDTTQRENKKGFWNTLLGKSLSFLGRWTGMKWIAVKISSAWDSIKNWWNNSSKKNTKKADIYNSNQEHATTEPALAPIELSAQTQPTTPKPAIAPTKLIAQSQSNVSIGTSGGSLSDERLFLKIEEGAIEFNDKQLSCSARIIYVESCEGKEYRCHFRSSGNTKSKLGGKSVKFRSIQSMFSPDSGTPARTKAEMEKMLGLSSNKESMRIIKMFTDPKESKFFGADSIEALATQPRPIITFGTSSPRTAKVETPTMQELLKEVKQAQKEMKEAAKQVDEKMKIAKDKGTPTALGEAEEAQKKLKQAMSKVEEATKKLEVAVEEAELAAADEILSDVSSLFEKAEEKAELAAADEILSDVSSLFEKAEHNSAFNNCRAVVPYVGAPKLSITSELQECLDAARRSMVQEMFFTQKVPNSLISSSITEHSASESPQKNEVL